MANQTPRNLTEAIERLESATHDRSKEIKDLLGKDYTDFKSALDDIKPYLEEFSSKIKDQVQDTKKKVVDTVEENPWATIAVLGVAVLAVGWIFGTRKR